jgi:U3 small nucleolar RNA-associated protein 3
MISLDPTHESDDEDINAGQGEEVLGLKYDRAGDDDDEEDDGEEWDEEEDEAPAKQRKQKVKPDLSTKGRYGKEEDSDEYSDEDEDGEAGSGSEDDEEGWGRQYYSRPSTRRAKEKEDEYDEKREEEREMEEREVRRLQRRAREALDADDWGLPTTDDVVPAAAAAEDAVLIPVVAPDTDDPEALLRHLRTHEPLKLALARDFPLVLRKLRSTARGIRRMTKEREGEESLHKGLGWLHYRESILAVIRATHKLTCYRGAPDVCDDAGVLHPPVRTPAIRTPGYVHPPDPRAPAAAQGGRDFS